MNCHDFEQTWNELLDLERSPQCPPEAGPDAEPRSSSEQEREVREHAAGCSACRSVHLRYETLRRALHSWSSASCLSAAPTSELVDRILTASTAEASRSRLVASRPLQPGRRGLSLGLALAAAAAVIALLIIPVSFGLRRFDFEGSRPVVAIRPVPGQASTTTTRRDDPRVLTEALADATAATWELARATSGPAARLGRGMLQAATRTPDRDQAGDSDRDSARSLGSGLVDFPSVLGGVPDPAPGSDLIQHVGNHLSSSVQPLSSTARHAFGFLLSPSRAKTDGRPSVPTSKGA